MYRVYRICEIQLKEMNMKQAVSGLTIGFYTVLILMMGLACHPTNSRTFTIPAGGAWNASWFETGITLREGQTVVFSATGQVRPSTGQDIYAGPDGTTEVLVTKLSPLQRQLIKLLKLKPTQYGNMI